MIVRRILVCRRPRPQTPGHTQMQNQHIIWLQTHEQIFSAAIHTGNRPPNRVFLQGCHVHEVAQLRLPHA